MAKETGKVDKNPKTKISIDGRRKIVDKVNTLSKDVHMEIFYFLKNKMNDGYTLNQNGVFINLNNLDNETLHELKKMVTFYHKNEKKLKKSYLERYCSKEETTINTTSPEDEDTNDSDSSDSSGKKIIKKGGTKGKNKSKTIINS